VIVKQLSAPLDTALAAAAVALAAAPAGSAEEWRLPDGTHAFPAGIAIDVDGRTVRLRGSDAVTLAFAAGGLTITAAVAEIIEVAIDAAAGGALAVSAGRISLLDVDVAATLGAGVVAIDLVGTGEGKGSIDLEDIVVTRAAGGDAIGLRAIAGSVRCTGATVKNVTGDATTGIQLGALRDCEAVELEVMDVTGAASAIGVLVAAGGRIEVARVVATDLSGPNALGVAVLGFGDRPDAGDVSAVDLDAERLTASARATGIYVAAPRRVVVRGFTAANISGAEATGAIVVGGTAGGTVDPRVHPAVPDVEVGFGSVSRVVASSGDAAGLRVIAAPSPRPIVVRDISIVEVVGAPVPASEIPPRDGDGEPQWQSWGTSILADLADDTWPRAEAPALLDAADVVGLAVTAVVDDVQPFLDELIAGDAAIVDSTVRAISGSALQLETGLRPAWVRRVELSTALRAGYAQADQLVLANTTWDRLGAPLAIGAGELRAYDSILSRITGAAPIVLDPDADWGESRAVYADSSSNWLEALGALPYVKPGDPALPPALIAGALPPPEDIDLSLVESSTLHKTAVLPPPDDLELTDDLRRYVGAHPPAVAQACALYDPLPPETALSVDDLGPSPVVDYRARDAKALLSVMLGRADQVMKPWTDRGAADFTTMLLETVAERLDQIAYQQERATAEGFLDDARLRRSVEDHVRPLDYEIDPGLSATAMLRFHIDLAGIGDVIAAREHELSISTDDARKAFLASTLAALNALADDGALELPAGTLAANRRNDDQVIVFATEEPLAYFPSLDRISLVDDLPAGATSALLAAGPHGLDGLAIGRWLVIHRGVGRGGQVVRITALTRGTDTVQIRWDPRRPLPWALSATKTAPDGEPPAVVLGNVTPAHHGVPLSALPDDIGNPDLVRFRELLDLTFDGGPGAELALPFSPVSIHAPGFPLPGETKRRGTPAVRVLVDDDEWTRADDLSVADAGDEVFVLRTAADGRATLRFGDGISGSALPARANRMRLDLAIGAGREGNVGEGILTRLLHVPVDASRGPVSGWLFREDMEVLRSLVAVDNPLPAVGGRDPEAIDHMRYRAPLLAQRPLSAITAADYERVALEVPEVAGAHARVVPAAVRPVARVTVLLRDEDTLDPDERLRRWAAVRAALEHARLLGFDVESVPPTWAPLDLDVSVDAEPHADAGVVRESVIAALAGDGGLFDPDTSGLGGDVQLADVYRAILAAHGVAAARVKRFRRLRPHAPERLAAGFIRIHPDEVAVVRGPARPASDGVLTVTVCGGLR
jgi:hypothetical protein